MLFRSASSVFQAEARALLLAALITDLLKLDRPTFLTDNQTLARAAASRKIDHPLLHWDTRNIMARFIETTSKSRSLIFHVKRDLNGVAHNCAHQAIRQDLSQPIFSCICSAHTPLSCPVISTVQNSYVQDFVINAVLCI